MERSLEPVGTPAPRTRLCLLGSFMVEQEQRPVHLPTRKVELLLAYLVLYPLPHAREQLATLLWGDTPDDLARHSLRTALHALRKHLDSDLLWAEKTTIQLNPRYPLWVDAWEFDQAMAGLTRGAEAPQSILDLYRGDLLTEHYDDWIRSKRERYRDLCLQALLSQAQQLRSQSAYAGAIAYAQKALAVDPTNEQAHQHLMFCHVALDNRHAALQQFQTLKRALHEELALEPSPESIALYQWVQATRTAAHACPAHFTNLPIPLSSFIGRRRELADLKSALAQTRLLTLVGVGGSGKTRLAMESATGLIDAFRDGVWWVELGALADAALVPHVVAKGLGVPEHPSEALTQAVIRFLRDKHLLLAMDNCEHLLAACADLAVTLLRHCRCLTIIATSREPLSIPGERVYLVPPLAAPTPHEARSWRAMDDYDGARLFIERASAADFSFALTPGNAPAVARVCRQLDGLPLALELAAAYVRTLSVHELATRLENRLSLLSEHSHAALPHQKTLRTTIDWSYDLLPEAERLLLRRLSVFVGRFTLEAVERVCAPLPAPMLDLFARLVNRSLVLVDRDGDSAQYRSLAIIRQYAEEKLVASGEEQRVRAAHLEYCIGLAEAAEPHSYRFRTMGLAGTAGGRTRRHTGGVKLGAGTGRHVVRVAIKRDHGRILGGARVLGRRALLAGAGVGSARRSRFRLELSLRSPSLVRAGLLASRHAGLATM